MIARPLAVTVVLALAACGQASSSASGVDAATPDTSRSDATPASDGATEQGAPTRLRIMAANTTSGTQQSYELPGIHLFQGLAPDVALVQELDYASGGPRALVDTAFGKSFSLYVEPSGAIPNGVISRYPILEAGTWTDASVSDRAFVYARIDVPGPVNLWAVSVHLLTTGATERSTEATQLLGYVQSKVPAGDYLVIGGDFNTDTTSEPALVTLSAVVDTSAPWPADQSGNTNSSINRNHPHDYVLPGPSLDARKTPVVIGADRFPAGLVFDSRVFTPLGDVAPIVAGDSGATGMQHMPVVRDFMVGG